MGKIKQINTKNRPYYFLNDMISIEDFDSSLLKIGKKSFKNIGIYHIRYIIIKRIDDCENIFSVNSLYLNFGKADRYIKEIHGNK